MCSSDLPISDSRDIRGVHGMDVSLTSWSYKATLMAPCAEGSKRVDTRRVDSFFQYIVGVNAGGPGDEILGQVVT